MRSVLIVGGGIAGLAHAVAARRKGFAVEVVEARSDWGIAGWGLSLTGPAMRALRAIGLAETCIRAGYPIVRSLHCDTAGTVRNVLELPSVLGPGQPAEVGMARPTLHRILREHAEQLGATLRTGLSVLTVHDDSSVRLTDGTFRTVDYVVGADGVHSAMRPLLGIPGTPGYTGQMVWRALVDRPEWATDVHTYAGPAFTTGLIPISPDKAYIFLTEPLDEPATLAGDELAERMRKLLAPFGGPIAEVRDTITDPGQVVRRPVHALVVDAPWHAGFGVLAGDAAHSPSPQMVSGAALAIEDAVVIADEVATHDDVPTALAAYSARRRDRARALVETSVAIGRAERAGRHDEVHALQRQGHGAMAAPY
ncbi:FAD-dependent monooxygenase [Actinoplanes sp. N902-109]|uniref:FAD-dependent monooxygenase n=1 Tax=Actinoplanes sp. (strain N902-109) TaxID=649831 RepID=UPI00059EDE1A|nr:FAD-dependent monooxygenase [Actinoplanes sp. N902-109]